MGQNTSSEEFHIPIEEIQDDVVKHAKLITEIAALTYEQFVTQLGDLNKLTRKCLDKNGNQLVFAVKKGTDSTIFWKGTVRIGCVKIEPSTSTVQSYRILNLPEFLQLFKSLHSLIVCVDANEKKKKKIQAGTSEDSPQSSQETPLTASLLLQRVDQLNISKTFEKNTECCICLERRPEVILPCAHSYCLPCIEQWNFNNKTCPICREKLETTDDTWVISEAPDASEISAEICAALEDLSKLSPTRKSKS